MKCMQLSIAMWVYHAVGSHISACVQQAFYHVVGDAFGVSSVTPDNIFV